MKVVGCFENMVQIIIYDWIFLGFCMVGDERIIKGFSDTSQRYSKSFSVILKDMTQRFSKIKDITKICHRFYRDCRRFLKDFPR